MSESNSPLEAAGVQGPDYIKKLLTNTTDPVKSIKEFQAANELHLPSLQSILPLFHMHNVSHLELHTSLFTQLQKNLIEQINTLGQNKDADSNDKLKELLAKTFPFIQVKSFRPIIYNILKNIPEIDEQYSNALLADRSLYNDLDIAAKRHIWKNNQSLFGDEARLFVSEYLKQNENILYDYKNVDKKTQFFYPLPKERRKREPIQGLAHMIGDNVKLYGIFQQFLRTLFCNTLNPQYCTLRSELLMTAHDLNINTDLVAVDPCYNLIWSLDALIKNKKFNSRKLSILENILNDFIRLNKEALGDISMVLWDPHAKNLLATYVITTMHTLIDKERMPRDSRTLAFLLRMLTLGINAKTILESQDDNEPKLDSQIFTRFIPSLMTLMVDDQLRQLSSELPNDKHAAAVDVLEHSGPIPEVIGAYIKEDSLASIIITYYTLHLAETKNHVGLLRILSVLGNCHNDLAFENSFLHCLILHLIYMKGEFVSERFCTAVFDEFFLTGITKENVKIHLLKLLWHIHSHLSARRLHSLVGILRPATETAESFHSLYNNFCNKIKYTNVLK